MTQQPEIRFRCDRCGAEISQPTNDQPALDRGKPPEGWLVLKIGADPTTPPSHLCPNNCAQLFREFMVPS
jgi:hypothetical protein